MKKFIVYILVATLFLAYVPAGYVAAKENEGSNEDTIYIEETGSTDSKEEFDLDKELNVNSEEEVETTFTTEGEIEIIESTLESGELYLNSVIDYNPNTGEMVSTAELKDEYGNDIKKSFSIAVLNADANNLEAILTDIETGEEYAVNSSELIASIWPVVGVLVAFIAKQGIKKAIKKWGPSIVKSMLKTSEAVAKVVAKELGYAPTNHLSKKAVVYYNKKGKPKYIVRDRDSHIGGVWKGASKPEHLASKKTRSGTYDIDLKRIGD
ncbi:SAR2788 family putative toxin [Peribacillus sp. NPDC076916]|uniref:SAR2788 family putative toxin n=1 Tax=Peribacillus sp. NPDC076916 TaxID=3390608 RepID=UPI003D00758B